MNARELNAISKVQADQIFKERMKEEHQAYLERAAKNAHTTIEKINEFSARTTHCDCHPWKHGMIKTTVDEWETVMEYINYFTGAWADQPSDNHHVIRGHGILARLQEDGSWLIEYIYVCEGDQYGFNGHIEDWCGDSLLEEVS